MPQVNWDVFRSLPGAADENFEKLCRSLVRRHYGRFGLFKQLANQPGVEFHLQLTETCDLGAPPRWIGWQCKWYELSNGENLGASRRNIIIEGMEKTRRHVPGVTVWKLWTHHTLTKGDQEWFYSLQGNFPELKLELLTATDIEDLFVGPGVLLRDAYFGELVLTSALLAAQHRIASAPFMHRYQQDVHVVVGAEEKLHKHLCRQSAWDSLEKLSLGIKSNCTDIAALTGPLKAELQTEVDLLLARSAELTGLLDKLHTALGKGDFDSVQLTLVANPPQPVRYERLLSKLRGARSAGAPLTANLVADIHAGSSVLRMLERSIGTRAIAVLAGAGEGKSELAVKVTQPDMDLPGGVLLLGKQLKAGQGLDDLVSAFKIFGRPAESFERLVEAVDAAGQRAGKRIPIVIDGLNEAEDPRNWKDELSRADELLKNFPYVMLIATLRNEFAQMCLPVAFPQVEHNGFQEDPQTAIDKYFDYYKIDATDAELPIEFLQHPLTLRIFCEVANPSRQHLVGVEALPNSLTSLFEAHFNRVAERVAELSPGAHRIYQEEVQDALLTIGGLLWKGNARSVGFQAARSAVGDVGRWDVSIIRALESEGILIRTISENNDQGIAFSYDMMAGHMMARHLLSTSDLVQWLRSDEGSVMFQFSEAESHTFAWDVFYALVSLYPQRFNKRHLWQDLSGEKLVMNALLLTAQTDPRHIGRETVNRFACAIQASNRFARIAFERLRHTRAARAHPFDMDFLHGVLLAMPNAQRDIFWTEWVREKSEDIENDIKFLSSRWGSGNLDEREIRRARWMMWTLTSTSRSLRDRATKALYQFAAKRPADFFGLAVESIAISDPYVPERMFAVAYGAALSTWSDSNALEMRESLPKVAREIYQSIFAPGASYPTWHALYQQYCLGTISLARLVDPACLSEDEVSHLLQPFSHLPSPFDCLPQYDLAMINRAKDAAIRMDFGNYTIGRLIPDRKNYDDQNSEYQSVLTSIVSRMLKLGYDPAQFETIDQQMNSGPRMGNDKHKVDRYGKKYGWIAYFEMWGVRYAQGLLSEWSRARPSDADIDPTFPLDATSMNLQLTDLFSNQPMDSVEWILRGPQPDYRSILEIDEVNGLTGPWVMINGALDQNAIADDRQVFTFIRGVIVDRGDVERLCNIFTGLAYPGNSAIPEEPDYHYTYAGEMPFSSISGLDVSEAKEDGNEQMVSANRWSTDGIKVEIPVQRYSWESYHSVVNQASGAHLPSKRLCEALSLRYRADTWDLHDASGVASLYREVGEYDAQISGSFCYLRRDLLEKYLTQFGKQLVWLMWGERGLHHRNADATNLREYYANHQHIHKRVHVYQAYSGDTVSSAPINVSSEQHKRF